MMASMHSGAPVTISKCVFQGHTARVGSWEEVRAIVEAVASNVRVEAGLARIVNPFAFRLNKGVEKNGEGPRSLEGRSDEGDVGSGDKLLHLLRKWDLWDVVLVVSRIDGGFMMAELLGVRRYKVVVDRAKKILDECHLTPLRQAVNTSLNLMVGALPDLVAGDVKVGHSVLKPSLKCTGQEVLNPSHCPANIPPHGPSEERSVVVPEGMQRSPEHGPTAWQGKPQCSKKYAAQKGRGPSYSGLPALTVLNASSGFAGLSTGGPGPVSPPFQGIPAPGPHGSTAASRRALELHRTVLPLARLCISAETVGFPRGHKPSFMGSKAVGRKRGRVNHFAAPSPRSDTSGSDGVPRSQVGYDCDNDSRRARGKRGQQRTAWVPSYQAQNPPPDLHLWGVRSGELSPVGDVGSSGEGLRLSTRQSRGQPLRVGGNTKGVVGVGVSMESLVSNDTPTALESERVTATIGLPMINPCLPPSLKQSSVRVERVKRGGGIGGSRGRVNEDGTVSAGWEDTGDDSGVCHAEAATSTNSRECPAPEGTVAGKQHSVFNAREPVRLCNCQSGREGSLREEEVDGGGGRGGLRREIVGKKEGSGLTPELRIHDAGGGITALSSVGSSTGASCRDGVCVENLHLGKAGSEKTSKEEGGGGVGSSGEGQERSGSGVLGAWRGDDRSISTAQTNATPEVSMTGDLGKAAFAQDVSRRDAGGSTPAVVAKSQVEGRVAGSKVGAGIFSSGHGGGNLSGKARRGQAERGEDAADVRAWTAHTQGAHADTPPLFGVPSPVMYQTSRGSSMGKEWEHE